MDLSMFNCPICKDYTTHQLDSIRIHCQKKHKLTSENLYKYLFLNGEDVKCACGCGDKPKFWSLQKGFAKYIRGHASRIHNNWGNNKIAFEKSLKKRRDEGLWSRNPWNRGKTKDNDESFKKIAEKAYGNENFRKSCSKLMKDLWSKGLITPATGSAHPRWKGGVSSLAPLCRSYIYKDWTLQKLKSANFKCSQCGSNKNLEVHHNNELFSEILQKGIELLDEPGEDLNKKIYFAEWFLLYHQENSVSGISLCRVCHRNIHNKTSASI